MQEILFFKNICLAHNAAHCDGQQETLWKLRMVKVRRMLIM